MVFDREEGNRGIDGGDGMDEMRIGGKLKQFEVIEMEAK